MGVEEDGEDALLFRVAGDGLGDGVVVGDHGRCVKLVFREVVKWDLGLVFAVVEKR